MKALLLVVALTVPAINDIPLQVAPAVACPTGSLNQAAIDKVEAMLDAMDRATDDVKEHRPAQIYRLILGNGEVS